MRRTREGEAEINMRDVKEVDLEKKPWLHIVWRKNTVFIHLFITYFLVSYNVLGTMLCSGEVMVNKTEVVSVHGYYILVGYLKVK